jgi:hypothetical protein
MKSKKKGKIEKIILTEFYLAYILADFQRPHEVAT